MRDPKRARVRLDAVGDKVLDGTVRTNLNELSKKLGETQVR